MAIELWRPMREMRRLTEEMDRLMEEAFRPLERRGLEPVTSRRIFPLNVYQKDNDVIVEASLPGIRPEDIDVSVSGRDLTIRAERKESKEVKDEDYYYREIAAGRFMRQVTLPTEVQPDKGEATYENGVLRLRLPVTEAAKETHLQIKAPGQKA